MIAIILAAGMGTRLRPLTNDISKPLLVIHDEMLIERMIKNCINESINDFIVITGYNSQKTDKVCVDLSNKYSINIKCIKNEKYDVTNTSVSTFLATDYIEKNDLGEDFILINGDNVVNPEIIHDISDSVNSAIVVDNVKELNAESFKLIVKDNVIESIGKDISIEESSGEFIGISKVINEDLKDFNKILKRIIDDDTQNYYDFTFKDLSKKTQLNYVLTNGLEWTEIDDMDDYKKAQDILNQLEN